MTTDTADRQADNHVTTTRLASEIKLAVLDMAGTTVSDDGLVLRAFEAAATAAGLAPDGDAHARAQQYVIDTMGQSKIEVFRAILGNEDVAQRANIAFEQAYESFIDEGVAPIAGAAEAITELRDAGIVVALTTGFSPSTQQRILRALGWQEIADVVLAPGEGGRGRPYPDLVLNALLRAGIDDVAAVAVVGDTANDIVSGRRAGASVLAGVLSGAHDEAALRAAGATHLLGSIAELPALLLPR